MSSCSVCRGGRRSRDDASRKNCRAAGLMAAMLAMALVAGCPVDSGQDQPPVEGPEGPPGISCWDLDGDGVGDPDEDINNDGDFNAFDCRVEGTDGAQGQPGVPGDDGLSCWDLDGDGVADPDEDINNDGNFNAQDCRGPAGAAGATGLACWDLDGDRVGDPAEDTNGDGNFDARDCQGPEGAQGIPGVSCWDLDADGIADPAEDINNDGNFDAEDCQGASGAAGLACWDIDGDGAGDPEEDTNGDGNFDALDCQGDTGSQGPPGLACWDLNGDGSGSPDEDINNDGDFNALDCQGDPGDPGLACWDLDGDGVQDPDEDVNNDGMWDALDCRPQPSDAQPVVESVSDATGGLLVVGDLLDIVGRNLDTVDVVYVDERAAPVLSQSATQLQIQIPARVASGTNTVRLVNLDGDTGLVDALAAVNVHRLAVMVGTFNDKIVVVDGNDHTVVGRIDRDVATMPSEIVNPPLEIAYANHGSLALVPTGDGEITWIDLTTVADDSVTPTNGTVDLHPGEPNSLTSMTTIGVAVSPDQTRALVADETRDQLWLLEIAEAFPPYNAPVVDPAAPAFTAPNTSQVRSPVFVSNTKAIVAYYNTDEVAVLERSGDTFSEVNVTSGGDGPLSLIYIADRATLLTASAFDSTVTARLVGSSTLVDLDSVVLTTGGLALRGLAATPDGNFAYAITLNGEYVTTLFVGESVVAELGPSADALSSLGSRSIAVEPVDGKLVYVGLTQPDTVDVFERAADGELERVTTAPLAGDPDLERTQGIGFQP